MNKADRLKEINTIAAIAKRAQKLFKPKKGLGYNRDLIDWVMDIEYAHKDIPLDLDALLNASNGNFGHDLSGIAKHLNRETKQLEDGFLPRYALN